MDQIVKRNRALPAPGQYDVKKALPIKGNVAMKLDRINFLDEAIRNNQESVAPGKYSPKVCFEELTVYRETLRINGRQLHRDGKPPKSRNGKFKRIWMNLIWGPTMLLFQRNTPCDPRWQCPCQNQIYLLLLPRAQTIKHGVLQQEHTTQRSATRQFPDLIWKKECESYLIKLTLLKFYKDYQTQ